MCERYPLTPPLLLLPSTTPSRLAAEVGICLMLMMNNFLGDISADVLAPSNGAR